MSNSNSDGAELNVSARRSVIYDRVRLLFISLAVIGIWAAIVKPAYEYRAMVGKVWAANDEAKQRVEQYVRANQKLPAFAPTSVLPLGLVTSTSSP